MGWWCRCVVPIGLAGPVTWSDGLALRGADSPRRSAIQIGFAGMQRGGQWLPVLVFSWHLLASPQTSHPVPLPLATSRQ